MTIANGALPALPGPDDEDPQRALDLGIEAHLDQYEASARASGEYTAQRLKLMDPARYAVAAKLLGEGLTQRHVADLCRVSRNTVAAVLIAERELIDALKKRTANKLRVFTDAAVDRLIAELPAMDIDRLAVALGIATQNAQLLDGAPTAISASSDASTSLESFRAFIDGLPRADVIDVEARSTAPAPALPDAQPAPAPTPAPDAQHGPKPPTSHVHE